MSSRKPSSRRLLAALSLFGFSLAAGVLAWAAAGPAPRPTPPPYSRVEAARNPITLQLQADEGQVYGWISGTRDHTGRAVSVKIDGKTHDAAVGKDNTFSFRYKVEKPTVAAVTVGTGKDTLRGSVALSPPSARPGPSVFFVVDRTAYRPGQALHFAGFLRREERPGSFVPVANEAVEVELTSHRKNTKAAKLKLTSDRQGRVVGSYTFTDADALDHYTLSIPKYTGSARVLLGEYRKSKVRLKINAVPEGDQLKLTFEALDFLDKPVPVTNASFAAQIVRRGKQKNLTLRAEDFVHHESKQLSVGDLDSLSEEDLLLWQAEGVSGQLAPWMGNVPLANFSGDLKTADGKPLAHTIDLKKEWLAGDCAFIVQGVVTDTNNREQRASATVQIDGKATATGKRSLELKLDRQRYLTGETIRVRTEGAGEGSLVVMKLSFQSPSTPLFGPTVVNPYVGRLPSYRHAHRLYRPVPTETGTAESIRRTLVTAVPIKDGAARLALKAPGAYKLIALVPKDDGTSVQQEATVVVKRPEDVPAFTLRLDREEITSGERLTGVIHSRYDNARALLTVRDSSGVRLTKPIRFEGGTYKLDERLPGGLRYGCTIDVLYPEDADHSQAAHAFVRVVPADQVLTVKVDTPGTVSPGSKVDLDLSVNRAEEVDLVVSVYDQSLLGIAADKAVNIRDFFLADERALTRFDASLLARRVGDVRMKTLLDRARKLVDETAAGKKKLTPAELAGLKDLLSRRSSRLVYGADVATLLRLVGQDVYFAPYRYGHNWHRYYQASESDRFLDVLQADHGGWRLVPRFVGTTLLLHETHLSYRHESHAWHPVFGWDHGYWPHTYWADVNYASNGIHFGQFNQLGMAQLDTFGRGMGRGDAGRSWNGGVSGNSMHSFMPEAQGFLSHIPPGAGVAALMSADADQGHILVRRDFSDSAYWNATVRTDPSGKAKVSFKLPDSLTNWQVVVTAVSRKMHVGSAKASFRTYKPVMVWPMLPRTFTEGDKVEVFASVHNRTDEPQTIKVRLKVENGNIYTPDARTVRVPAKSNVPVYWTFAPGAAGFTQLLMTADCPAGSDASLKRLPVLPAAAEQIVTASGGVKKSATIEVPEGVDLAASRLEITFAPSLAADLADTLNYLVEYPYGCVEQTMSRFLPAIKVAQVLRQFKVNHPELEKKLPGCVAGGIKRLLELQQGDGGWGWNGNGATHEMFTPYALYGLLQAEKAGYQIPNETAVNRGLDRLQQFIRSMGDGQTADRVYCLYVFSHRRDLTKDDWEWIERRATQKALSDYALGLAIEMAVAKEKKELAGTLVAALRERAKKSGDHVYWESAGFSRWGNDRFEVTAQALRALVAHDPKDPLIDGTLLFFNATKRGDRWNSTKDTAMILYALTDYLAKTEYNAAAKKVLSVAVNDGAAQEVKFADQLTKKVTIPGKLLRPGKNTLAFDTTMTGVLYRAVFRYWKTGRDIEPMDRGIEVKRTVHLVSARGEVIRELKSGDTVPRGSYVMCQVDATHRLPANMRYVLVESPKASGGETVPADDARFTAQHQACTHHVLREDREAMTCFHHEETPRALGVRSVFLAELSGDFVIPPAKVELMYQTETRGHSGTFVLKVEDKKAK